MIFICKLVLIRWNWSLTFFSRFLRDDFTQPIAVKNSRAWSELLQVYSARLWLWYTKNDMFNLELMYWRFCSSRCSVPWYFLTPGDRVEYQEQVAPGVAAKPTAITCRRINKARVSARNHRLFLIEIHSWPVATWKAESKKPEETPMESIFPSEGNSSVSLQDFLTTAGQGWLVECCWFLG